MDQNHLMQKVISKMRDNEEQVLKTVVKQILKREPVIEDAKRLTKMFYEGEPLNYDLAFDGVKVGKVVFDITGINWGITFHPEKEFE